MLQNFYSLEVMENTGILSNLFGKSLLGVLVPDPPVAHPAVLFVSKPYLLFPHVWPFYNKFRTMPPPLDLLLAL